MLCVAERTSSGLYFRHADRSRLGPVVDAAAAAAASFSILGFARSKPVELCRPRQQASLPTGLASDGGRHRCGRRSEQHLRTSDRHHHPRHRSRGCRGDSAGPAERPSVTPSQGGITSPSWQWRSSSGMTILSAWAFQMTMTSNRRPRPLSHDTGPARDSRSSIRS